MAESYICGHCGSRLPGPPAATISRPSGRLVPVCFDGLLAQMPERHELERRWLELHLAAPPAGLPVPDSES